MALPLRQRSGASYSASGAQRHAIVASASGRVSARARLALLSSLASPPLRSGGALGAASGEAYRGALWTPVTACARVLVMDLAIGPDSLQSDGIESGQPHTSRIERGHPRRALWV